MRPTNNRNTNDWESRVKRLTDIIKTLSPYTGSDGCVDKLSRYAVIVEPYIDEYGRDLPAYKNFSVVDTKNDRKMYAVEEVYGERCCWENAQDYMERACLILNMEYNVFIHGKNGR